MSAKKHVKVGCIFCNHSKVNNFQKNYIPLFPKNEYQTLDNKIPITLGTNP